MKTHYFSFLIQVIKNVCKLWSSLFIAPEVMTSRGRKLAVNLAGSWI